MLFIGVLIWVSYPGDNVFLLEFERRGANSSKSFR
jgi:hypothetical protein